MVSRASVRAHGCRAAAKSLRERRQLEERAPTSPLIPISRRAATSSSFCLWRSSQRAAERSSGWKQRSCPKEIFLALEAAG